MPDAPTTRLGLVRPLKEENFDLAGHINANWDKLDAAAGWPSVPNQAARLAVAGAYVGMAVRQADTAGLYVLSALPASTAGNWTQVQTSVVNGVDVAGSVAARNALTPFNGKLIARSDRGWLELYDGAAWRVVGVAAVTNFADLATYITNPYAGQLAIVTSEQNRQYRYSGAAWVSELPSYVILRQTVSQSIPTSAWTPLNFDTEDSDGPGWHSTASNTNRLTPTIPCTLVVVGTGVLFVSNAGNKGVRIAKNGSPLLGRQVFGPPPANELWSQQAMAVVTFNGTTDYIETQVFQGGAAALNTFQNADFAPGLQAYLIAKG